jgi:hypothetical protein
VVKEGFMSIRGNNWVEFATHVHAHVDLYTVPQFGDFPDDNIEKMSAEDCIKQIRKYVERFGKNQRGHEDQLMDMMKIAHFANFAWEKLRKEGAAASGSKAGKGLRMFSDPQGGKL